MKKDHMKKTVKKILSIGIPALGLAFLYGIGLIIAEGNPWLAAGAAAIVLAATAAVVGLVNLYIWATSE